MNDFILFEDLKHNKSEVSEWRYQTVGRSAIQTVRVYYNPKSLVLSGFEFYVLEIVNKNNGATANKWVPVETFVRVLYSGEADYDGVRHLFMGSAQTNNQGYLCSPKFKEQCKIFQQLYLLEEEYCDV